MRALRILPVNQTHGGGYEVEVAAGSEGSVAHDVCRAEHAALPTACVCVVRELRARCCVLSTADGVRVYTASTCDLASSESTALPASNTSARATAL